MVWVIGAGGFHLDSLDLYSARARAAFTTAAAHDLHASPDDLKSELGRVLVEVEAALAAANTAPELPPSSAAERSAALDLLRDPDLGSRVISDLGALGIVGEEENLLACYLAVVSRKTPRPLGVVIQSSSAAGKSTLADAVLALVPEDDRVSFSAITGQALYYVGEHDLAHKVLAIAEHEGATRAAYALKLLVSDGRLAIGTTGKDPTSGKLATRTYHVAGPVALVITTTQTELDPELANRCLVLSVDEEPDQTRKIFAAQRRSASLAGLAGHPDRDVIVRRHHVANGLLAPLHVVVPEHLVSPVARATVRARRDHMKWIGLVSASALLHQHQRETGSVDRDGEPVAYVIADERDANIATGLYAHLLGEAELELAPQSRRLLDHLADLTARIAAARGVEPDGVRFTRRDVIEHTGWTAHQVRARLAQLCDHELVLARRGSQGRRYQYQLADPATPEIEPGPVNGFATSTTSRRLRDPRKRGLTCGNGRLRDFAAHTHTTTSGNGRGSGRSRLRDRTLMTAIKNSTVSVADAVGEHLDWLAAHNYAATTIANRARYLDAFATFLTERDVTFLDAVRLAHLEAYQHHLYQARKADGALLSFRTQTQRLIPVKVLFGWATRRGLLTADPSVLLELPRAERRLPDATLTAAEAETVMALPDISTALGLRDRAILEVFWATGIRRAELAHVLVHHIDRARATLFVRHGKGARDRYVPLGRRAAGWVDAYLTQARPHLVTHPDAGVLFVSATGRPLALDWLSRTVRAYIHAGTGKPLLPPPPTHRRDRDARRRSRHPLRRRTPRPRPPRNHPDLHPSQHRQTHRGPCPHPPLRPPDPVTGRDSPRLVLHLETCL